MTSFVSRWHHVRLVCLTLIVLFVMQQTTEAKIASESEHELVDMLKQLLNNEDAAGSRTHESRPVQHYGDFVFNRRHKFGNYRADPCAGGVDLTALSGTMMSPGFNAGSYPSNVRCGWRLTAPEGKVIQITFKSFRLQESRDCSRDFLILFDGASLQVPTLGRFCGGTKPNTVTSSGQSVVIMFVSDSDVNDGGFALEWASVDKLALATPSPGSNPCTSVLELRDLSGTIQFPLDRRAPSYDNNARCAWLIVAPSEQTIKIQFSRFSVELSEECEFDSLSIYDGSSVYSPVIGRYCGPRLPQELIQSTGSVMTILFMSDAADALKGFTLTWTSGKHLIQDSSVRSCGSPYYKPTLPAARIVNGVEAQPNSWPWQCSVRYKFTSPPWGQWCGASVIDNPMVVLTAAHCVYDDSNNVIAPSNFKVVCGGHNQAETNDPHTQTFLVDKIITHEFYYANSQDYDIAVFQLQGTLTFNMFVSPVCLPTENAPAQAECVVTGWGTTLGTGDRTKLRQVVVPILSQTRCSQESFYGPILTDNMLCAGYKKGGKDACTGDSGGPLVCQTGTGRWVLQGIVSYGAECAKAYKPGVYARVTRVLPWIRDKTGVSP